MATTGFPPWLITGVLLGLVAAILVFVVYLVGVARFDDGTAPFSGDPNALRMAEMRAYFAAIGEPVQEHVVVDGHDVAFWLPDRDVAITFDARTYFDLDRAGVTAVLIEHEVPGDQIGGRLPFETPTLGRPDAASDDRSWARRVLGVDDSADADAIDDAYRDRIKEAHPDLGGDAEELADVLEAYETLSN